MYFREDLPSKLFRIDRTIERFYAEITLRKKLTGKKLFAKKFYSSLTYRNGETSKLFKLRHFHSFRTS